MKWSNLSLQSISHYQTTVLAHLWPSGPNPDPCLTNLTSVISLPKQAERVFNVFLGSVVLSKR